MKPYIQTPEALKIINPIAIKTIPMKYIVIASCLFASCASHPQKQLSADKANDTISVIQTDEASLFQEYQQNEIRADERFKGQYLLLSGTVADIGRLNNGLAYITFLNKNYGPTCIFKRDSDIAPVNVGEKIEIVGTCKGKDNSTGIIILAGCWVNNYTVGLPVVKEYHFHP